MFLDRLDGNLLPVEDPCGQCGLNIGLFKDLQEVFNLAGTAGGYDLKIVEVTNGYPIR